MKRISYFISITVLSLALTSCGCFDKFESRGFIPADAYGNDVNLTETSLAQMSWREFFTDPLLQQLIDSVLARNTDINSMRIAVEKSEASLKAAKLAYLPSLYFSPQGTLSSFDYGPVSKTYNLPLQLSLDIDAFGSITNQKRKSQAVLMQAKISEESLRANLVSTVAQQYFMLQLLDRQLQILTATDSLWNASLETEKILWENGKIYSTAVNQMESSYLNVKTQIVDTRRNIRSVENAICRLLAQTPQRINRSAWGSSLHHPEAKGDTGQRMFDTQFLLTGVPAMLLKNRPDIRLADYAMEEAFYNTQMARSAFFPSITLSGTAGWTNSAGVVVNPGKMLLNAVDPEGNYDHVFGREGITGARGHEIGVHALRGGTVAGEHSVFFFGPDETLEFRHSAASRRIFAVGAMRAARFVIGQPNGLYSMDDVLA